MSITDELREWWVRKFPIMDKELHEDFTAIAYRIDAEHEESIQREHESAYDAGYAEGVGVANKADMRAEYLRGKNDGYDEGWDAGFASADDWLAQHEDAMAEHGWVRRNKEHVISHATVEVTPHIDWSRMADELDEFVEIVRGMALAEGEDA